MKYLFRFKAGFLLAILLPMIYCNVHAQKKYVALNILQPDVEECFESPEGLDSYQYKNVDLYPNPAEDFVTIHYRGTSRYLQIVFIDVTGRKVFEEATGSTSGEMFKIIDVTRLEGFYTILIYDDSKICTSHIVIH